MNPRCPVESAAIASIGGTMVSGDHPDIRRYRAPGDAITGRDYRIRGQLGVRVLFDWLTRAKW
jgi:hypothetical protein